MGIFEFAAQCGPV